MEKVQFVQTKRICGVPLEGGGIYSLCHNIDFHRKYTVSLDIIYIYISYLLSKTMLLLREPKGLWKGYFPSQMHGKLRNTNPQDLRNHLGSYEWCFFVNIQYFPCVFPSFSFILLSTIPNWPILRSENLEPPPTKTPLQRWSRKCHTLWRIAMWHSQWRSFDCWAPIMCANTQLGRNMVPTKQNFSEYFR